MIDKSRLFDFLSYQLEHFPKPDMLAGKINGKWVPYSTLEVKDIVDRLSIGLMRLGVSGNDMQVENQDKIAVISKNRPEWIFLDLACQQTGAILCPLYPTTNVHELEFIFKESEIKYVFAGGREECDKIISFRSEIPSLKNIYSFDGLDHVDFWKELVVGPTPEERENLEKVKNNILPKHCATIIYTSGTTGIPKGVMLSHINITSNIINAKKSFPFYDNINMRALSFLPLNHIFERMVSYVYISSGIGIYYAQSTDTVGEDIKDAQPALFCTVPRLLEKVHERIMEKGKYLKGIQKPVFNWAVALASRYDNEINLGRWYRVQLAIADKLVYSKWRKGLGQSIQFIVTGGAACQVRLLRMFTAAKIPVYEGYGPTENSPIISANLQRINGTRFGTVGKVIEGQVVKIEADGEICVKGPSVMMGYFKRPELTTETIIDGWLHTGDIGTLDKDGFLKITDRKKELFKTSGGKYVAPQPIENKLKESPFIEQMMVIGEEQKFTAALIVPSFLHLKEWMEAMKIGFNSPSEAVQHPEVIQLFRDIIHFYNPNFNPVEQIKKFELLPNEWTIDSGELTPTLKVKRKFILEKYQKVIEKIYAP